VWRATTYFPPVFLGIVTYVLWRRGPVSAVVMGLVPHHALVGNGAPFVDAFAAMFPQGTWAGKLIAATAVVSGIGALNGRTLVTAEVSRAPVYQALIVVPAGIILYAVLNGRRERVGRIPQPIDNPPYDPAAQAPAATGPDQTQEEVRQS